MFTKKTINLNNFRTIQKTCKYALDNSVMIAIYGYPGAGKTVALKRFISKNRTAYYVKVEKSMKTRDFYLTILNDSHPSKGKRMSLHEIFKKIKLRFSSHERSLLIIDEVGKIDASQLEYLHELRDLTENYLGIILAGPEYFHTHLEDWKNADLHGIPELHRRISWHEFLDRPTSHEKIALCNTYGITDEKVINEKFMHYNDFGSLTEAIRKYLTFDIDDEDDENE